MKTVLALTVLTGALLSLAGPSASAASVTALPGGAAITIPEVDLFSAGPINTAPGITWSSDNPGSVYGYDDGYGFNNNGIWGVGLNMVGANSPTATMTFAFANPVAGFGGFFNWATGTGTASIATYDSSHNLLESTNLTFLTGGGFNTGEFHGFLDTTADISYFEMQGAYIGGANFVVQDTPSSVPEPATLSLLGLSLLGLGWARKRKQ